MRRRKGPEEAAALARRSGCQLREGTSPATALPPPELRHLRGWQLPGDRVLCLSLLLLRMTSPSATVSPGPAAAEPRLLFGTCSGSRFLSCCPHLCQGRDGSFLCLALTVPCVVSVPSCPTTAATSTCPALPRGRWPRPAPATDAQSQHSVNSCNHRNELVPRGKRLEIKVVTQDRKSVV